ncbi:LPS export ABC transporter permease LptG [Litoribrevibacter euphylliae]|uniref:LPS export ABC transporter permease LptG n=1 Tax=Litoribrevibacter euphylliae TaxID=1834034 RepID=A0ABV7HDK7_9GAMM
MNIPGMNTVEKYIAKVVFTSFAALALIILGLDLLFSFLSELDDTRNQYQMLDAFLFMLMTIPRRLYEYLPLLAMIGALVGIGRLANNSELVILRAAGMSTYRIVYAVMKAAFLLMLVGFLLGQLVVPATESYAQTSKAVKMANGDAQLIRKGKGFWHKESTEFVHFAVVEPSGRLHGVTRYQFDDQQRLRSLEYSKLAEYKDEQWVLYDTMRTEFVEDKTQVKQFAEQTWDVSLQPALLSVIVLKPDYLAMTDLYSLSSYLDVQGLDAGPFKLSFWRKLYQPLAIGALVLIGISFVFGPLRSVAMGTRLFYGIITGLTFKYLQDFMGPAASVFGIEPWLAALMPIALCALIGFVMIRRAG